MEKSKIEINVCYLRPDSEIDSRTLKVFATSSENIELETGDDLQTRTFRISRVECKGLWRVFKSFAECGDLEEFK